mgnify:CR=1 FL=1
MAAAPGLRPRAADATEALRDPGRLPRAPRTWALAAPAAGTLLALPSDPRRNHRCPVERGVLGEECGELLSAFFRARRAGDSEA